MRKFMGILVGFGLCIVGCSSSSETEEVDSGTEPMVDLGPEPEPDMGPRPDLGSPCPATCPSLGQNQCNPRNPPATCGLCVWTCSTTADCPGGLVSTDAGVPDGGPSGTCFTCDENNICVPLETPDSSCPVGTIGHPCQSGGGCEPDSVCASFPNWAEGTGICSPDCTLP